MDDELDTSLISCVDGAAVEGDYFDEPLRWWRERGESSYPILASMAYDLFSLPGMSSGCERAFSGAKRMITDARYNLKGDRGRSVRQELVQTRSCKRLPCLH